MSTTAPPSGVATVAAWRLAWLEHQYFSPLSGFRDLAAGLVADWGYDPAEHSALMDELQQATAEAFVDTAYEVMREHGLRGPADPAQTKEPVRQAGGDRG